MQNLAFSPRHPGASPASAPHIVRACLANLASDIHGDAQAHAAHRWRGDTITSALIKAAASPGATADHAALVGQSVGGFLGSLQMAAASALLREALTIELALNSTVAGPFDAAPSASAPWVGENDAIPVSEGALGAINVGPAKKLAILFAVSRELIRQPSAERVLNAVLRARAERAFDAAFFSADAADTVRVAGLLNGVTPLDAGPIGTVGEALAALAGALADNGGSGEVFIAAHPALTAKIMIEHPQLGWTVAPSRALAAGTLVAIDPTSVIFAVGPELDIARETSATLHMSTTPLEIVSATGPTTADPVRSLFQTDGVGLRLILDLAWGVRPGSVAFIEGIV